MCQIASKNRLRKFFKQSLKNGPEIAAEIG